MEISALQESAMQESDDRVLSDQHIWKGNDKCKIGQREEERCHKVSVKQQLTPCAAVKMRYAFQSTPNWGEV